MAVFADAARHWAGAEANDASPPSRGRRPRIVLPSGYTNRRSRSSPRAAALPTQSESRTRHGAWVGEGAPVARAEFLLDLGCGRQQSLNSFLVRNWRPIFALELGGIVGSIFFPSARVNEAVFPLASRSAQASAGIGRSARYLLDA